MFRCHGPNPLLTGCANTSNRSLIIVRPLPETATAVVLLAMTESKRRPSLASSLIGLGGRHAIDPDVLHDRLQERDWRRASDTRSDVQRWLGDPPPARSALTHRDKQKPQPS